MKKLNEDIVSDVSVMHDDHQVQMARKECYHAAESAICVHQLLKHVENHQLEPWIVAKLSLAAEYLKAVEEHLTIDDGMTDYVDVNFDDAFDMVMHESAGWDKFEQWKQSVLSAYPEVAHKIKFVSQDNGRHISAELAGQDRSYGFFDMDTDEGEILGEAKFDRGHGTIIDAFTNPKFGRITWSLVGGVNFISSQLPNQEAKMHASGDRDQIAAKWAHIKARMKPESTLVGENATGGATSSAGVATAFAGKNKKNVGSLFGGSYQQNTPFNKKSKKK